MKKVFRSMVDLGKNTEDGWFQKIGDNIVLHRDPRFYGIYGNDFEGWRLAYWGENMIEPLADNMYYDPECTEKVNIKKLFTPAN